jgi:hypothetical protein
MSGRQCSSPTEGDPEPQSDHLAQQADDLSCRTPATGQLSRQKVLPRSANCIAVVATELQAPHRFDQRELGCGVERAFLVPEMLVGEALVGGCVHASKSTAVFSANTLHEMIEMRRRLDPRY